jgi:hypothetical protein
VRWAVEQLKEGDYGVSVAGDHESRSSAITMVKVSAPRSRT